jgi:demethylmenaquinone methyltransferase / 2-methoxy-6-polyprenyl-1,4-benzoquinol methylase
MAYIWGMTDSAANETDFGFRRVNADEKQGMVNDVFAKAAERYDQMNDLMSGGLHRIWKDDFVGALNPPRGETPFHVLDVAGGTGDIAFRIAEKGGGGTYVTIADISPEMVAGGVARAGQNGLASKCTFTVGNAEALAFPDQSFDAYTIAFGIRNVTHIDQALREACRVLKPGGHFLCLEFSQVDMDVLKRAYDAFSFSVIPAVGKVVTGNGQPYRYLVESIRKFPPQESFKRMIADAGFSKVTYRNMSGGIVAMHSGWRI